MFLITVLSITITFKLVCKFTTIHFGNFFSYYLVVKIVTEKPILGGTIKYGYMLLAYSDPGYCIYFANKCWTVSLNSPPNLQLSFFTDPLKVFHAFVSIICSFNFKIDVVFFRSSFSNPICISLSSYLVYLSWNF